MILGQEDSKFKDKIKSGLILYGPPGTGKTLLCELISRAANRKIFFIGAGEMRTTYQGSTQIILKRILEQISSQPEPCVLVIDEIDAIASTQTTNNNRAEDTMSLRFLNTCFEGLDKYKNKPYIFCTSNHIGRFDKAIKRRFKTLFIDLPQRDKLVQIIIYYMNKSKDKKAIEDNVSASFIGKLAGYASSEKLSGDNIKDIIDQTILNEETGVENTHNLPFGYTKGIWSGTDLEKTIYNAYCQFLEEKHNIEKEEEREKTVYAPITPIFETAKNAVVGGSIHGASSTIISAALIGTWSYKDDIKKFAKNRGVELSNIAQSIFKSYKS